MAAVTDTSPHPDATTARGRLAWKRRPAAGGQGSARAGESRGPAGWRRPKASPEEAVAMRAAMGRFGAGVVVVTARHPALGPFGQTASSMASVSLAPPLVLVCLRSNSATLAAIEASWGFAINVLAKPQLGLADRFANGRLSFDDVPHRRSAHTGSPLLDGTLVTVECELHELGDGGDHRVVVGRVLALRDAAVDPRRSPSLDAGWGVRPTTVNAVLAAGLDMTR
jgi:flavin reductase (DIM6/NTAB) family NADH-FMN oxidoreductase RutF